MVPAVVGVAGPTLAAEEAALLRRFRPAGVILFSRNIEDPAQVSALTGALREVLPGHAVIAVDQEGGRVARLRPPHWGAHPAAGALADARAAWITGALIGRDSAAVGIDVVCAPVLDLCIPGAHGVIGDRAFAGGPEEVARMGAAMAAGLLAAGVQPVAKHAPGHGRALVDSHLGLPVVGAEQALDDDVLAFALCAGAVPWMMTAHILYQGLDAEWPGTLSPVVIRDVIRGRIGFSGVLVTDDLNMQALSGRPGERAARALAAGCDIALHCSGVLGESAEVLEACPAIPDRTLTRLAAAREMAEGARVSLDAAALMAERGLS